MTFEMVECKQYRASVTTSTCIARQKKIAGMIAGKNLKSNNWGNSGEDMAMYLGCIECEIGKKLYKNRKGEIKMSVRTKKCEECGLDLPADHLHFTKASRSKDRLSKICRQCKLDAVVVDEGVKHTSVPDIDEKILKTCVCYICGKEKPLNAENFHRNRTNKNGFENACKACRNAEKRFNTRVKGKGEQVVFIDFFDHPDLLDRLKNAATMELRDPDKQIIYFLKKALSRVDVSSDNAA